ncbi:MAG: hypothetical protein LBR06_01290 [Bacteroidales bacterium]|nr:hypothetical protein [Bacteroidales bacterium]
MVIRKVRWRSEWGKTLLRTVAETARRQHNSLHQNSGEHHIRGRRAYRDDMCQQGDNEALSGRVAMVQRFVAKRVVRMRMSNRPPREVVRMGEQSR